MADEAVDLESLIVKVCCVVVSLIRKRAGKNIEKYGMVPFFGSLRQETDQVKWHMFG